MSGRRGTEAWAEGGAGHRYLKACGLRAGWREESQSQKALHCHRGPEGCVGVRRPQAEKGLEAEGPSPGQAWEPKMEMPSGEQLWGVAGVGSA